MIRNNLLDIVKQEFPEGKGVEVGVFKGGFSKVIVNNWKGLLYMVDPWRPLNEGYNDASNHKNHLDAYAKTMESIKGYEDQAIMIRSFSNQAVDLFPNNSLDFVYIDGNHAYEYVKEDMEIWYPKLKSGGYFMGHDYLGLSNWYDTPFIDNKGKDKHIWMTFNGESNYAGVFGVNTAVDEFCNQYKLSFEVTEEWLGTWWFKKPFNNNKKK